MSLRKLLFKERVKQIRFFFLLVFCAFLIVNSIVFHSFLIGAVGALGFLSLVSLTIGEMLFSDENSFFRGFFGVATFLLLLAISGFGLMLIGMFTEYLSVAVLIVMGVLFGIVAMRGKKSQLRDNDESSSVIKRNRSKDLISYLLIWIFLLFIVVAFRFLLLARTDEGGASVWLEISPLFIPTFAVVSLILALIILFTPVSDSVKLSLLLVYAFLAHSLFLIVWYPSRYGDPLMHLGEARYTANTGTIYAFDWMTSQFLIVDLISYRGQYALVIFLERMFSVDMYWTHSFLVPLLWSIFVPSLAYKIAELMSLKKSRVFPSLAALSTGLFSSSILWGAVSVPNSLGFIFFFLSAVFLIMWMKSGGRWNWLLSLLAVAGVFITHIQSGLFALILFLWGNVVQRSSRTVLRIASLLFASSLYPVALYLNGASFTVSGLFVLENFLSFQSEIATILLGFGLVGLVLGVRGKYINLKVALTVFVFYMTILFEYYLTNFGMTNLPFGAGRILVMADFLLVPFVALGMLAIASMLRNVMGRAGKEFSFGLSSKRVRLTLDSGLIAFVLISLFVSGQATSTLYQAYPRKEAVDYQPSAYTIEAVRYIDTDARGRYVVLCDLQIARVAIGFLGVDHGYGVFGISEWDYPIQKMYLSMTEKPSIDIMQQAMNFSNATLSYVVVWVGFPGFEEIVQRVSEILPVYRVFGDGNLYIFKYPIPVHEEPGPSVTVVFDGVLTNSVNTSLTYIVESEIVSTLTLAGYSSYNITEYPMSWVFLDLKVNNVSRSFDEVSDINSFVYVSKLNPSDVLTVRWRLNRDYSNVVWKEDSFRKGWRTHDRYVGTLTPKIVSDGNILNISATFTPGPYLYYYYIKPVDISLTSNSCILVRWKSDGPIALVFSYFDSEFGKGADVVPLGSESTDWTVTIVKLPSNVTVSYVMVGISNLRASNLLGARTLSVDYILISSSR